MGHNLSSILILTYLIAFLGVMTSISTAGGSNKDNTEIKEIWAQAFKGTKNPDQVYGLLEKVQQVYASLNTNDLSSYDEQVKETYDILFNAWNPTPDKCNETDFTLVDALDRYALTEVNISEYWQHCERKWIQVCEPIFEAQLRTEIGHVRGPFVHRVKLLIDSMMGEWNSSNKLERDRALTAGTLQYMQTLEGPLSKSVFKLLRSPKDRFKGVYKRLVVDLCATVFETGKKQMDIFKVIRQYIPTWEPSGLIKQWIEAEAICSYVFLASHEEMTYKLLRDQIRERGLFGRGP